MTLEVVDPHVLGAPAAVALPAAELAVDRCIDDRRAIGREHGAAALRHGQRRLEAALGGHLIEPAAAFVVGHAVRAEEYELAVRAPVEHAIVRATARRHAADIVVPGELARCAAPCRNHVDLTRAVVLGRKCDPAAIR